MDAGKFMEFIYFNSFMISMNFLDQLVTDKSKSVLKWYCLLMIVILLHKVEESFN